MFAVPKFEKGEVVRIILHGSTGELLKVANFLKSPIRSDYITIPACPFLLSELGQIVKIEPAETLKTWLKRCVEETYTPTGDILQDAYGILNTKGSLWVRNPDGSDPFQFLPPAYSFVGKENLLLDPKAVADLKKGIDGELILCDDSVLEHETAFSSFNDLSSRRIFVTGKTSSREVFEILRSISPRRFQSYRVFSALTNIHPLVEEYSIRIPYIRSIHKVEITIPSWIDPSNPTMLHYPQSLGFESIFPTAMRIHQVSIRWVNRYEFRRLYIVSNASNETLRWMSLSLAPTIPDTVCISKASPNSAIVSLLAGKPKIIVLSFARALDVDITDEDVVFSIDPDLTPEFFPNWKVFIQLEVNTISGKEIRNDG